MNHTHKTVTATTIAVLLTLGTATAAGALPWDKVLCTVPMGAPACKVVETGQAFDRKANAVADAGVSVYQTGESAGSLAVNGTKLAGTVLGKASDAAVWADDAVARMPVPSRSLQPGECLDTTSGRYCLPVSGDGEHRPVSPPPETRNCFLDRTGRRWCVVR